MNFCKDCKYRQAHIFSLGVPLCHHKASQIPIFSVKDPVAGQGDDGRRFCNVMRMFDKREHCPHWEQRPPCRWYQFWRL